MLGQLREIFGRDSVVKAVRDQLQCWAGTGAEEEGHRVEYLEWDVVIPLTK
jgi:hypothetical protein